jgi:hypothetical protein
MKFPSTKSSLWKGKVFIEPLKMSKGIGSLPFSGNMKAVERFVTAIENSLAR